MNKVIEQQRDNVQSELCFGDRIGFGGMFYIRENEQLTQQSRINKKYVKYVDVACPFCGQVHTYSLSYLRNGKTQSCNCMRGREAKKVIANRIVDNLGHILYDEGYVMNFGWVYDSEAGIDTYGQRAINVHSKWLPEVTAIKPAFELDPILNPTCKTSLTNPWAPSYADIYKSKEELIEEANQLSIVETKQDSDYYNISTDVEGQSYNVFAHGKDELWIKTLLMSIPEIAQSIASVSYVASAHSSSVKENDGKTADFRTITGKKNEIDIYEEYDGSSHPIKNLTERDKQAILDCARNNQGLIKFSTKIAAFKGRNEEAVLAIRAFAIKEITKSIRHNNRFKNDKWSTVIRITSRRNIEKAIVENGEISWEMIAKLDDFYRSGKKSKQQSNQMSSDPIQTVDGQILSDEKMEKYEAYITKAISENKGASCVYYDLEDLRQEGRKAVVEAYLKYDPDENAHINTWVTDCIQNAIKEFHKQNDRILSGGAYLQNQIKKVNPTSFDEDIVDRLVENGMRRSTALASTYYNLTPVEYGDWLGLVDPESKSMFTRSEGLVANLHNYLTPNEIEIVNQYFDLDGQGHATMRAIGSQCGKSRKAVSYAINKILVKLRHVTGIEHYWLNSDNAEYTFSTRSYMSSDNNDE